jgi:hypothetical protein
LYLNLIWMVLFCSSSSLRIKLDGGFRISFLKRRQKPNHSIDAAYSTSATTIFFGQNANGSAGLYFKLNSEGAA